MSSTTTSPATHALKAPAAPVPGLTEELFLQHMTAMHAHYMPGGAGLAKAAHPYALPQHILHLAQPTVVQGGPLLAARPAPPIDVTRTLGAAEQDTLAFVNSHHQGVLAAISGAQAANSTSQFVQAMQALEQRDLADHASRIHALFQGLIAAGRAHPGRQAQILVAGNQTGSFLAGLLQSAHAAAHGIAGVFGAVGHATASAVHNATQAAGNWVSGAAQSVGSFFKSLF